MNYCEKCGAPLVETISDPVRYDPGDGAPWFTFRRVCPNRKYSWDGHTGVKSEFRSESEADDAHEIEWHVW